MAIHPTILWSIGALFVGAAAAVAVDFAGVRAALEDGLARERADVAAGAQESPPSSPPAPALAVDPDAPPGPTGNARTAGSTDLAEDAGLAEDADLAGSPAVPEGDGTQPPVARFDLLRVEPDGSLVIAGSGPADATMEIIAGSRTIAMAEAAANGDFVAVLDEPLAPGDYQIVLRATAPDGVVVTSRETAIVAIPEPGSADVLALVEAPGAPSRLITTPGPRSPALTPVAEPEEPATGENEEPVASEERAPTVGDGDATSADVASALAANEAADADAPFDADASADASAPAIKTQDAAPRAGQAVDLAALPETGANDADEADAPPPGGDGASVDLRIEAVEIDGSDLFVAGAAPAGTRLRLYANAILLGDTITGEGGRFLVQVRRDLPVGDYIVRADAIDPLTGRVLARVSVPFTRSAGERLAAVAVAPLVQLPASPPPIPFDALTSPSPATGTPDGGGPALGVASAAESASAPGDGDDDGDAAKTPGADEPPINVPQALGVLQGPPPLVADTPQAAAELVPTGKSVIIRRGDTLWQISRRVYGQGVKYTTIYLANRQQINDPDLILPGQVFDVPDEAIDDAEAVHRALRDRN